MLDWKPIETAPHEGKFLVAMYAPTNWELHVTTIRCYPEIPKIRENHLRYCTHWAEMPPEPKKGE